MLCITVHYCFIHKHQYRLISTMLHSFGCPYIRIFLFLMDHLRHSAINLIPSHVSPFSQTNASSLSLRFSVC